MAGDRSMETATLRVDRGEKSTILHLAGRLDDGTVASCWQPALEAAGRARGGLKVDCAGVEYCGGAGFALLAALEEAAKQRGLPMELEALPARFRAMFDGIDWQKLEKPAVPSRGHGNWVAEVGHATAARLDEWAGETAFVGEVGAGLVGLGREPRRLRLREWWVIVEKAGTNALPIVALISFLMGMIMAFQSAMPMRQFGVDIFVVNLVALAITRELGPLMTAIVLAGRSGSAFAAEIGTMKVNEEVAALTTMGLSPVRFLAVPRVLAGIVVTPVLTVYSMVIGIAGGFFVMMMLGFPLATLLKQLAGSLTSQDVVAGLIKSFFFGAVVAGVGCMRGLQTGAGASAVGDSTTRSVVTSIFLIVVLDAIFAVVYYQLKF
ncbi:MAG: ABC transporter permease [Chthoniobacterales bacterium]|jgi:phospholipid/cholesterol/gamma-HCH transport system permease protein